MAAGINGHVAKPVNLRALQAESRRLDELQGS